MQRAEPRSIEIDCIETHSQGQVVGTIIDGIDTAKLGTGSIRDRRAEFDNHYGWVPDFLTNEPRGHATLVGCIPLKPTVPDADSSMFFFNSGGYLENCGDAIIGTTTVLLETGRLDPADSIRIETPGGIVPVRVDYGSGDRVERLTIQGLTGFAYDRTEISIDTFKDDSVAHDSLETEVAIAHGAGNWIAYVDADDLAIDLDPNANDQKRIRRYGLEVQRRVTDDLEIVDPFTGEESSVSMTVFCDESGPVHRNAMVSSIGTIGRSPCGTGTVGKLALQYDRGELAIDEEYLHESLIGSRYVGTITSVERRNDVRCITAEIGGTAHIIGESRYVRSPEDDLDSFTI